VKKLTCLSSVSIGALLLVFCSLVQADPPEMQDKGRIQNGGVDLKVNLYADSFVADWNNDGAKDLLVGRAEDAKILLYLNQGTDLNPVFNGYSYIEMNGNPIVLTGSS
jgi:hypothetical protein